LTKNTFIDSSSCIFINSDIKDKGLVDGVKNILQQFEAELKGIGTIVDYSYRHKEISTYIYSLFKYGGIDDNDMPIIY
jgi:hypothetical protein